VDDPRVDVRDQLLDAIVGHVRRRDPYLAELADRILGVVRANDGHVEESGLRADVAAFAEMNLGRGKRKPASAFLRQARFDAIGVAGLGDPGDTERRTAGS
jgi:hypothetical protein